PGASYDPETHIVYAQAANAGLSSFSLREPPKGFSDIRYVSGIAGREFVESLGPGFGSAADSPLARPRQTSPSAPAAAAAPGPTPAPTPPATPAPGGLTVQGLSMMKPPYGLLAAINLDRG